jgi:hypothetical protein
MMHGYKAPLWLAAQLIKDGLVKEKMLRATYLISMLFISVCLSGCAAMIMQSTPDEPKEISFGATEAEISKRFGPPIKSNRMEPSTLAQNLGKSDPSIVIMNFNGLVVSTAVFQFKGRLDSKARAGQAGFDSFMTLGLSELFLIPKALWERTIDEDLELTVWFSASGQALAYQWRQHKTN